MAKDIHSLSKSMLGMAAWPDERDFRTGQPVARPAARPSDRFMPLAPAAAAPAAAAPGAPAAPPLAADIRRQRESLAEHAWPDDLGMVAPSQQGQDDADPDAMTDEEELAGLEESLALLRERQAVLKERLQAKAMSDRAGR
ncbi:MULTISPECIES: hypothetical protein [unclassified Synechococcus]|uniref:hypothetical protein n=1 Tax=unclassified Synechococcus TaxID=2626047 RepID=UPI001C21AC9D|nr:MULTISPECIES: hypothetical protein [unclassified Synechococcus]